MHSPQTISQMVREIHESKSGHEPNAREEIMELKVIEFLQALQAMIAEKETGAPAPWEQVPEQYQEDFLKWALAVKQNDWDGIEETGWMSDAPEYMAALISRFIGENTSEEERPQT
jgi:hypothetical protein